jgi:glycine/D-amino acid oxidase-like deaminating enzyme
VDSAEVIVVGAGVMGLWSAHALAAAGRDVLLVDAWGPGNARATSGDENRVIRCAYGASSFYTGWARRSLGLWRRLEEDRAEKLFVPCGVLWMVAGDEAYARASLAGLERERIPHERLDARAFARRYPQIDPRGIRWALLEPASGLLLARAACRSVARAFEERGGRLRTAHVLPGAAAGGRLRDLIAAGGGRLAAATFVFACGPWLPGLFPEFLGSKIRVTRKEVFYFGTPPGDDRFGASRCPIWMESGTSCYGIPAVDGKGFKVHPDVPGRRVDPTSQDRRPSARILALARACLRRRFPALAAAPVLEARVCQYESTRDDHMICDRHPDLANVWIVGGGSGHCFKHGPVIGGMVAEAVTRGDPSAVPPELRLDHSPSGRNF